MSFRLILPFLLAASALPAPASAQYNENRAVMERMDRMERDLMMMHRQIARGGSVSASSVDSIDAAPPLGNAAAQNEVRLSALEEELRGLRGKMEENEFQVRRLNESMEKLQKDVDFRFNELNPSAPKPDAAATPAPATASGGQPTTAGDGVLRPAPADTGDGAAKKFDQPRDLYNYAFRLLNQTRYEESAKYFQDFTRQYPKDPLIGNAHYWLGETYYIRRDYAKAADSFRQGFEALPSGPKAADNLLKLSMTLSALKRDKDACVVLEQILTRFKNSSTALLQKAQSERTRMGCQ